MMVAKGHLMVKKRLEYLKQRMFEPTKEIKTMRWLEGGKKES
jgi:hypothetical protein